MGKVSKITVKHYLHKKKAPYLSQKGIYPFFNISIRITYKRKSSSYSSELNSVLYHDFQAQYQPKEVNTREELYQEMDSEELELSSFIKENFEKKDRNFLRLMEAEGLLVALIYFCRG